MNCQNLLHVSSIERRFTRQTHDSLLLSSNERRFTRQTHDSLLLSSNEIRFMIHSLLVLMKDALHKNLMIQKRRFT